MSVSRPHSAPSLPATIRRSSANAPRRAGASRWKVRMSVSRPHPSAFVAHHGAPLIGERTATRWRNTTEADGAGVNRALSVRAPASRTGSNGGNLDAFGGHSTAEARKPNAADSAPGHLGIIILDNNRFVKL